LRVSTMLTLALTKENGIPAASSWSASIASVLLRFPSQISAS
jgi:hypothetical protein